MDSEEEKAQRVLDNDNYSDNYSDRASDGDLDYDLKQNLSKRKQARFTD